MCRPAFVRPLDIHTRSPCDASRWRHVARASRLASLLAGLIVCTGASAQQQQQDVTLTLTKEGQVQLTKLDDWTIAIQPADGTIGFWQYEWDYLCVYSSTGRFRVDVTGAETNAFIARSGDGSPMPYEVWSYSRITANFGVPVRHTGPFTLDRRRGSRSLTCADEGFNNSNLFFAPLVRGADFNAAAPGIYRDFVTITVSPI